MWVRGGGGGEGGQHTYIWTCLERITKPKEYGETLLLYLILG